MPDELQEVSENQVVDRNLLPHDIKERVQEAARQNNALMAMMDNLLEEDVDFGKVPGVKKPFLHQPGAQQLGLVFKLRPEFEILDKTIDFNKDPILVVYDVKCKIYQREAEAFLGEGVGSCNNYEEKYKYRYKYINNEKTREVYEDPLSQTNTILKMAKKRAYVDAILTVTGASRLFTQDPDFAEGSNGNTGSQFDNKEPENIELWFGKHKGEKLSDLPTSYLKWLKDNAKQNNLQEAAASVLEQMKSVTDVKKQSNDNEKGNTANSSDEDTTEGTNSKVNQENPEKTVLWFGKFEGKTLEEVNSGYLEWLVKNSKQEDLKVAAKLTLDKHQASKEDEKEKTPPRPRELSDREEEINDLIADDPEKKNKLFSLLKGFNAKSINNLNEEEYLILRGELRDDYAGPTEAEAELIKDFEEFEANEEE